MSSFLDSAGKLVLSIAAAVMAFLVGLLTSSIAAGVCTLGGLSQTRSKQQASSSD